MTSNSARASAITVGELLKRLEGVDPNIPVAFVSESYQILPATQSAVVDDRYHDSTADYEDYSGPMFVIDSDYGTMLSDDHPEADQTYLKQSKPWLTNTRSNVPPVTQIYRQNTFNGKWEWVTK